MRQPLELTTADKRDPVWLKLVDHWTARLAELRAQNDGNLSPEETAAVRGRIKELKANLALANDLPVSQ